MARIVFGLGTSHGPMLSTPPAQWDLRAGADRANPRHAYRGEWLDFATERVPEIDRADRDSGGKAARGLTRRKSAPGEKSLALQRPRVFYRRESESRRIVVAKY